MSCVAASRSLMSFTAPVCVLTCAALMAASLTGCDDRADERQAGDTGQDAPVKSYAVRGKVVSVDPDASRAQILHESVPTFEDRTGKVIGMDPMAMPFKVIGYDVSTLTPGDKVVFTMCVDWGADQAFWAQDLQLLPADTALVFTAPPRAATQPADD